MSQDSLPQAAPKGGPAEHEAVLVGAVSFSHGDIARVVDLFYTRIQMDPVLKVPFQSVHDWPEHVQRLTHFWWTKFGGKPYLFTYYDPVAKHFYAGFNRELLSRWLAIFENVLRENLREDQRRLWANISESMGQALAMKNELFAND